MLPAIGQGALAIEGRVGDEQVQKLVAFLNHPPTQSAVAAERAFSRKLGGGCQVPIAAHARVETDRLTLNGLVAGLDGRRIIKGKVEGSSAKSEDLGRKLAEELLEKGAGEILHEVRKKE